MLWAPTGMLECTYWNSTGNYRTAPSKGGGIGSDKALKLYTSDTNDIFKRKKTPKSHTVGPTQTF